MRGKGYDVVSRLCRVRITPACAGKRDKTGWTTTCPRDHPRMCGEKPKVMNLVLVRPGSPPHVRGKELRVETCFADNGITPACAGKSNLFVFRRIEPKDHPRVCGEKAAILRAVCVPIGSPPRMRGKAGEYGSQTHRPQDHPRVCGEKQKKSPTGLVTRGSPPHVRGKGADEQGVGGVAGITPAYAGKRHSPCMRGTCPRDHPRVCGEKLQAAEGFRL